MTPSEQLREKVLALDAMIKSDNPGIETWCRDIHANLKKDESLVQLLTDEEMGIIVSGMSKIAQTILVKDLVKSSKSKSAKSITLDML